MMNWRTKFDDIQRGTKIEVTNTEDLPSDWGIEVGQHLILTDVKENENEGTKYYIIGKKYLLKGEFKVI